MAKAKVPTPIKDAKSIITDLSSSNRKIVKQGFLKLSLKVVAGIIIIIIGHILGRFLRKLIIEKGQTVIDKTKKLTTDTRTDEEKDQQVRSTNLIYATTGAIVYYGVIVGSVFVMLKILGIQATGLVALIGSIGIGIGLALQGVLSDISSGILLSFLHTYAIGESM